MEEAPPLDTESVVQEDVDVGSEIDMHSVQGDEAGVLGDVETDGGEALDWGGEADWYEDDELLGCTY